MTDWAKILLVGAFIAAYCDFLYNPEKYGDIMRRYDNVRFYQLEDNCSPYVE